MTQEPMIFECINPSDAITLLARDPVVAWAAVKMLNGMYFLRDAAGKSVDPDRREWDMFVEARSAEIADCLLSFQCCSVADRPEYERVLAAIPDEQVKLKYRTDFKEERRSSMNDICRRAWEMGWQFKERARNGG